MSITTAVGYFAVSLVFATFCANRMASLRVLAIASNISFICYGSLLGLWPIVVLHCAMLPVNIVRLHEARAALRDPGRPHRADDRSPPPRFGPIIHWFALCRERERLRHELSAMRSGDFGDLAVRRV
jgi:hypothetical protein